MKIIFRILLIVVLVVSFHSYLFRSSANKYPGYNFEISEQESSINFHINPLVSSKYFKGVAVIDRNNDLSPILTFTAHLPIGLNNYTFPISNRTGIDNIYKFLEECPTNDPAYSKIRSDFTIRIDGKVVNDIPCTEPLSSIPSNEFSQELVTLQTLRIIYYMDADVQNFLPWTSLSMYDWMAAHIGGINLLTEPGYIYCCDTFGGEKYIGESITSEGSRGYYKTWQGISGKVAVYGHETRHADGGHYHVTGCEAFPNPTDPKGCDPSYDLSDLGSYGIQYWLNENWSTGYINIGISCNSTYAQSYVSEHVYRANDYRRRFVNNIPPLIEMPLPPYGGPCYDP
jgi:hypothetical protein